jgi:NAD(P)-dependent dehydrogenase (short-subunit alcohol dehydrogenase family)
MVKNVDMKGKICLVTGSNTGLGKATAMGLASLGATVVMVCRDRNRGETAMAEIKKRTESNSIDLMIMDLSSQESIRRLAEDFKAKYRRLDVLVNNAAVLARRRTLTKDGFEMTFAVNHLGYFLLTNLLLDQIKASSPSRIVNVSSDAHKGMKLDFDDLHLEKSYSVIRAYGQSKLCNILFTYELAKRLKESGVTVNTLHPGVVKTEVFREMPFILDWLVKLFAASPEKGASTSIYLASSPEVEGVTGKYFKNKKEVRTSRESYDDSTGKKLWKISEELTKL